MTEAEWVACTVDDQDTGAMGEYLRDKGSPRQLRLFACACCRRVGAVLTDPRSRRAVDEAERYADRGASEEALMAARDDADLALVEVDAALSKDDDPRSYFAAYASYYCAISGGSGSDVYSSAHAAFYALGAADDTGEAEAQGRLLCDIFDRRASGLHFPSWVIPIAQAAYDDRYLPSGELDLVRLSVLADALEDAGCDNVELLEHLRSPGPHVRGCWALDQVLGKR